MNAELITVSLFTIARAHDRTQTCALLPCICIYSMSTLWIESNWSTLAEICRDVQQNRMRIDQFHVCSEFVSRLLCSLPSVYACVCLCLAEREFKWASTNRILVCSCAPFSMFGLARICLMEFKNTTKTNCVRSLFFHTFLSQHRFLVRFCRFTFWKTMWKHVTHVRRDKLEINKC